MTALLDVNVLIALAWPNHVHHGAARAWFEEHRESGWATCTITEAGFVRVSCTPAVVRRTVTPLEAITVLEGLVRLGSHAFWPLDRSLVDLPETIRARLQGYRQVTDAVLLAAALDRGGRLATLDERLGRLLAEEERRSLAIIPV